MSTIFIIIAILALLFLILSATITIIFFIQYIIFEKKRKEIH